MANRFPGFSPKALTFFRQLEKNNQRDWFNAHKEIYENEVRRPMIELVRLLAEDVRKSAVDYVPDKPEKVIFRIYRDTRFSHDKTPYKTHIGAFFQHRRVPKNRGAGFYFELSHRALGIAGGMYMPEPEQLLAVRQALLTRWEEFAGMCAERALVRRLGALQGEMLARVPKGFDPLSPAAEWLRRKQFYFYAELDAKIVTGPGVYRQLVDCFRLTLPMVEFLNQAVISSLGEEEESRPVRPAPMF